MIDPMLVTVVLLGAGVGTVLGMYIVSRWMVWAVMGDHLDA